MGSVEAIGGDLGARCQESMVLLDDWLDEQYYWWDGMDDAVAKWSGGQDEAEGSFEREQLGAGTACTACTAGPTCLAPIVATAGPACTAGPTCPGYTACPACPAPIVATAGSMYAFTESM